MSRETESRKWCQVEFFGGPHDGEARPMEYPPATEYRIALPKNMFCAMLGSVHTAVNQRVGSYRLATAQNFETVEIAAEAMPCFDELMHGRRPMRYDWMGE